MIIEFGEYLPDLPDFNNPGATEAKNVIPDGVSYKEMPSLTVYSDALNDTCRGAIAGRNASSGDSANFAGDETKLYLLASAAWSDVSKSGGYNLAEGENWSFTQFGNRILATNINDPIQSYSIGTSSVFADLAATAPQARYITALRNFVLVGNTFDGDGSVPNRIRWCAFGDPTSWTVSASTQSDFQDLDARNGWVKQVSGGEYGVVFQEKAISRVNYTGSPVVFQIDTVEENRGTQASNSVIKVGNFHFYLGLDGFYVFDGNQSISIGENKVDKTFFADLDTTYMQNIFAGVDYTKKIVLWAYPGAGNSDGRPNKILLYNYAQNAMKRWSYAEFDIEYLFSSLSEGYTLDGLDSLSSSIDTLSFSLDSRIYTGNNLLLSAFDSSHRLCNFTGSALTALIETQEAQISPGQRTNLMRLRPLIDGSSATITVQIGTRNSLTESVTWGNAISPDSIGEVQLRSNARYHRARINISSGFDHAQGIEILEARAAGRR
jgi:hypothetical protein